MQTLTYSDYDILVLIASGAKNQNEYFEIPSYLEPIKKGPLSAEDSAEYFNNAFQKHQPNNSDFMERLDDAIDLFLKKTPLLNMTITQEKNFQRGYELFKKQNQINQASSPVKQDNSKLPKLVWNGEQKQFVELIMQLQEKKWINSINDGELLGIVTNLTYCFDLTKTQKKKNSNLIKSIYQIFKPSEKEIRVTTKRYKKMFASITENTRKVITN